MKPRRTIALLLSVLMVASSLAPATRAQDVAGLDGISAEYHDMLDLFYRPLDPHDLLQAGWSALGSDASRRGVSPPSSLPALPDDADAAFNTFAGAYSNYVANLPSSLTPSTAAADVENGM